jgi:MFS family permease
LAAAAGFAAGFAFAAGFSFAGFLAAFFAAFFAGFFAAFFAGFFAAFFAAGFFAAFFAAGFLAAFFAAGFFATFLAAGFLAAFFTAGFLAAGFFAAGFFAVAMMLLLHEVSKKLPTKKPVCTSPDYSSAQACRNWLALMNAAHAKAARLAGRFAPPKKTPVRIERPAFFLEVMGSLAPRRRLEGTSPSSMPAGACAFTASKFVCLNPCIQCLVTLLWNRSHYCFSPSSAPRRSDIR